VVQVNPGPSEVIKIPAESKTGTTPFESLCFRSRARIIIIGPFFSCGRMRPQAEDGQLACDQHLRSNLLVFASFKVCAGVNVVSAGPAGWGEQGVQAIGISPLIGIR